MGIGEMFLALVVGAFLDPVTLIVLAVPGLAHRPWWPRLLYAAAWVVVVQFIVGPVDPLSGVRQPAVFTAALGYMTLLYGVRRAVQAMQTERSVAAQADGKDPGDID